MTKDEMVNVSFSISEINTIRFSIVNSNEIANQSRDTFVFNITVLLGVEALNKNIFFDITQEVFTNKEMKIKVCELSTRIVFTIQNFDEVVINDKAIKAVKISDPLMLMFLSIALSTSRGILAAKTEGTSLSGVYMPVVDPKTFKPQVPVTAQKP